MLAAVSSLGGDVTIDPAPQEVSWSVPLDEDDEHSTYDPAQAAAYFRRRPGRRSSWRSFARRIVVAQRRSMRGGVRSTWPWVCSLASRRDHHPPTSSRGTRWTRKRSCSGGGPATPATAGAAFYAYAHPAPAGSSREPRAWAARWEAALGEYVLDWDDVCGAPTRTPPASSSHALHFGTPVWYANGIRRSQPAPKERHHPSYDTAEARQAIGVICNAERSLRTGAVALLGAAHAPDGMRSRSGKWLAGEHQVGVGLPEPIPLHQRVSHGRVALNLPCRMPGLDEVLEYADDRGADGEDQDDAARADDEPDREDATSSRMIERATATAPSEGSVSSPRTAAQARPRARARSSASPGAAAPSPARTASTARPGESLDPPDPADHERDAFVGCRRAELAALPAFGQPDRAQAEQHLPGENDGMASKTWLIPPVGRGKAGTNIKSRIVTAKLFSANTSPSAPSVFVSSLRSHRSSWSLKGSPVSVPVVIAPGPVRGMLAATLQPQGDGYTDAS